MRRSCASISRRPRPPTSPTSVMTPPSTATSASKRGRPVPSTTVPRRITMSCILGSSSEYQRARPTGAILSYAESVLVGEPALVDRLLGPGHHAPQHRLEGLERHRLGFDHCHAGHPIGPAGRVAE